MWFILAAIYNVLWGISAILFPNQYFRWFGMPPSNYPALFQCIGMIVAVYAVGYLFIALDPVRYGAFAFIGVLGKCFGIIGFLWAAFRGELPWAFGWINVTNDLIWLPAFFAFCVRWRQVELEAGARSKGV